jgi:hypothetical protein
VLLLLLFSRTDESLALSLFCSFSCVRNFCVVVLSPVFFFEKNQQINLYFSTLKRSTTTTTTQQRHYKKKAEREHE